MMLGSTKQETFNLNGGLWKPIMGSNYITTNKRSHSDHPWVLYRNLLGVKLLQDVAIDEFYPTEPKGEKRT